MVLIFSRPWRAASSSKRVKTRFSSSSTSLGVFWRAKPVKSTRSANITVASGWDSAMTP